MSSTSATPPRGTLSPAQADYDADQDARIRAARSAARRPSLLAAVALVLAALALAAALYGLRPRPSSPPASIVHVAAPPACAACPAAPPCTCACACPAALERHRR